MKKLALYLIILIASLFVVDRIIGLFGDYLYKQIKTGQSGGRINYYLSLSPSPDLLIMGNSRCFRHVNPADFPLSAYNISHAGMDQSFHTTLLSILITEKKIPKYILLHVEPFDYMKKKNALHTFPDDPQQLKYYYNTDTLTKNYIDQMSSYEKFKFSFQSYRYNGRFISIFKNLYQTMQTTNYGNGYEPLPATNSDSIHTILSKNRNSFDSDFDFDYMQVTYLEKFIALCKSNNIQLICFSSTLYRQFDYDTKYSELLGYILNEQKIPYINYIKHPSPELNNPWLWNDSYHLNEKGATIESAHLSKNVMDLIQAEINRKALLLH
jgi:hypothetical protein